MTAAQRQQVRNAIDQAARAQVEAAPVRRFCGRCGGNADHRTIGCRTCTTRANARAKRLAKSRRPSVRR